MLNKAIINLKTNSMGNENDGKTAVHSIITLIFVILLLVLSPFTNVILTNDVTSDQVVVNDQIIRDNDDSEQKVDTENQIDDNPQVQLAPSTRAKDLTQDMIFFLHNVSDNETAKTIPDLGSTWNWFDTNASFNSKNTTLEATGTNNDFDWYLCPSLAEELTTDSVTLKIWAAWISGANPNAGINIEIFERDNTGTETSVKSENFASQDFPLTGTLKTWTVDFNNPHTFAKDSSIKLRLSANPGSGKYLHFFFDSPRANSRVIIPTIDHMEIQSVVSMNYNEVPKNNFDQIEKNKTLYFRTTVLDPFGGYDINFVGLTVFDPGNNAILDNISMYNYSGNELSYSSTYNYTWNYSGQSSGRFNISVLVIDNNGYNHYNHFGLLNHSYYPDRLDSYFYIGGLPKFVWVKTIDNMSIVMDGAEVFAEFSGNIMTFNTTDSNGLSNLTMDPANYKFIVKWQGVVVFQKSYDIIDNITVFDPLILKCQVYYPILKTIDNSSIDLSDANLYITPPNGTPLQPFRSDINGNVAFSQIAGGDYKIVVRWRGVEVNSSIVTIDSSGNFIIKCSIFYINFRTVDTSNNEIENIGVTVFDHDTAWVLDFKISNMSGIAITRVPLGIVDVVAYWQNIIVNTTMLVSISGNDSITLVCNVFNINLKIIDSRSLPVEDAQITIRVVEGGDIIDSGITNDTGEVDLHLLAGKYFLEVFWHNVKVSSEDIFITNIGQKIIQAEIYYVNFKTVDAMDNIVSEAQIYIYSATTGTLVDSTRSNESGVKEIRLPKGLFDIEVYWKTVLVNFTNNYLVNNDINPFTLDLWVYYIQFNLIDSKSKSIANAQVIVSLNSTSELLDSGITDKVGGLSLRLPKSFVDIEIIWDRALIYYESMYSVSGNAAKQISAWVYYITFNAVDSKDKSIAGALIEIISSLDEETVYTETSDNLGAATFRLPLGSYKLNTYWQTVLVYDIPDLNVIGDVTNYKLPLRIYYINFIAKDSHDISVSNAQVTITTNKTQEVVDSRMTNADGTIESRLPVGLVDIKVFWKEVEVNSQSFEVVEDVPSNATLVLSCNIFYMTATTLDYQKIPLAGAQITVKKAVEETIMDSTSTSSSGVAVLRLPIGRFSISVEWYSVEVYFENNILIEKDISRNLDCSVYYIKILAKDAKNIELEDARILLAHIEASNLLFTNTTDESGSFEVRLPIGAYDMNIFWQDVLVYSGSYYFNKDDTINVQCNVYYFQIHTEDSRNTTLQNAQTVLLLSDNQNLMVSNNSGDTGQLEFRLPSGDYDILVYWKDVLVKTVLGYSLISSLSLTLVCDVFYFDVVALDVDGIQLENADVHIKFYNVDEIFDSMVTDASGTAPTKAPIGDYDINIYWKGVEIFSEVNYNINTSQRFEKTCNVFYLTVKTLDKANVPINDVSVKIKAIAADLNEHLYTNDDGVAEFRLPIGNYEVRARLQDNYLLKDIDEKKEKNVDLISESKTVKLTFSEYPPSFETTPAFYGVALPILLLLIVLFLIWYLFIRKRKAVKEEEEIEEDHVPIHDSFRYRPIKGTKYDKIKDIDSEEKDDEEPKDEDKTEDDESKIMDNGDELKEDEELPKEE
jgi:hypothetical protein